MSDNVQAKVKTILTPPAHSRFWEGDIHEIIAAQEQQHLENYILTAWRNSMAQRQHKHKNNSDMNIPDFAIERLARCMLPMLQKYYESEEGQQELAEWKKRQEQN